MLPSANDNEDSVVVKIVPVNGHVLVNGQPQMKHIDMLAEIIISTELSKLSSTTSKRASASAEQLETAARPLADDAIDDNAEAKAPGNQIYLVTLRTTQLTQTSFLQKNQMLQNVFLIFLMPKIRRYLRNKSSQRYRYQKTILQHLIFM